MLDNTKLRPEDVIAGEGIEVSEGGNFVTVSVSEKAKENWDSKATTMTYNLTLPASQWTTGTPSLLGLDISEMLSTDRAFMDVVTDWGNPLLSAAILSEYSKIDAVRTSNGGIQFICFTETPTIDLPVQILGVR